MWRHPRADPETEKDALFNDLMCEVYNANSEGRISFGLRNRLEKCPFHVRQQIVARKKFGCSPLFVACKRGQLETVVYLIQTCGSDLEQKCTYEVPEDRSRHVVTPLWCASVAGKLSIVKLLIQCGADVNAVSDSGSTATRSACFMSHYEVVKCLVENGADVNRPNYNGGTCLINSIQSADLCRFLLKHGANVNAKDNQNKTALHYAIQDHRLETTKLLLSFGADPNIRSRYGDDALQTACLKGATTILDYLVQTFSYSIEQIANAYELLGVWYIDEDGNLSHCLRYWSAALRIRSENGLLPKQPQLSPKESYRYEKEFATIEELNAIGPDSDRIRIQSLLVVERILGTHHKDTIFRLMYRGAAYADAKEYQRCIEIWRRALQIRIEKDTVLYCDTCFTAQALIKVMADYNNKSRRSKDQDSIHQWLFQNAVAIFRLLTENVLAVRSLLDLRPQDKRQITNFSNIVRCITHLIYLMIDTSDTLENQNTTVQLVKELIRNNIKCPYTNNTILHLCISLSNSIMSSFFSEDFPNIVFPDLKVVKLLLECGADVNAREGQGRTPLHEATIEENCSIELVELLLRFGAHLDTPDITGTTPLRYLTNMPYLTQSITLKCLSARAIVQNEIQYANVIPKTLEGFVRLHQKKLH